MNRQLFAVVLLLLTSSVSQAQPEPEPKDDKVTIPLMLSPAALPKPLSRYYLYPEYGDQQPGERVSGFMKCFMEQAFFFNGDNDLKRSKWLEMPLAELPADVRELAGIHDGIAYSPKYAKLMVYMDQAARYTRVEWNEWFNLRNDGINTLLPEVQKMRTLAVVLKLRMRGEIKNGEFDRAIQTAKSLFGLAQALEQHPSIIGNLVGVAIAGLAINGLEEMVQQPGCPNLFWSFVDLPSPLMSFRRGIEGERVFLVAQLKDFMVADRAFSPLELERYLQSIEEIVSMNGRSGESVLEKVIQQPRVRFAMFALDEKRVGAARERLTVYGKLKPDAVKTFSPLQVVITDDLLQFEIIRDDMMKVLNLRTAAEREKFMDDKLYRAMRSELLLAPILLPALSRASVATARLDQRIAYLRIIEAIRLHALSNGGKLPATLAEIQLPIPLDPISGKAFEYTVKDGVATLHGEIPLRGNPQMNRYYELRVRK